MMHLFDRLLWAQANLPPVQPQYCIVYEDAIDEPAKVVVPAPEWLACALAGGILPPIDTYLRDANVPDGEPKEHPYAPPIGPMTEEEAMEYLVMKDIPRRVWDAPAGANQRKFVITRRDMIPTNREYRNAWSLRDAA